MKFAIVQETSPDIFKKIAILNRLSDVLDRGFSAGRYGDVETVLIGVNCVSPKVSGQSKDFETGTVIYKKFTKGKKLLDLKIKLNYAETINASDEEVLDIFENGVMRSYSEIAAMKIENFDIDKFYSDLKKMLGERTWLKASYQAKTFYYESPKKERLVFFENEKMDLDLFWDLIEKCRFETHNNLGNQIEMITSELTKKDEKEIVGFECTLRELLLKAYHYNVMALQKIVEGNVSDDSFLYFRCKLILYGRITFNNAIEDPNHVFAR